MKKLLLPLMLSLSITYSCNISNSNKSGNNESDTIGYYAARNLKGLASFKIGTTTYKQALDTIKAEIRKDSRRYKETNYKEMPKYTGYDAHYEDYKFDKYGNVASTFYREDFGSIFKEITFDTADDNLKEDIFDQNTFGCPNIKVIDMGSYYIGDIEIFEFKLSFFNDTLYKISSTQNSSIDEGFKAKYGAGKFIDNSIKRGKKVLSIDELYIWENSLVKAESKNYCEYKYKGSEYLGADMNTNISYFIISTKNPALLKKISNCDEKVYKAKERLQSQIEQQNLNKL
jgi:hypothetical protein